MFFRSKCIPVAGIALTLAGFVPAARASIITNGSFETNTGNGSTPSGWTKDFNAYGAYRGGQFGMVPQSGSWMLHVGSSGISGGVYQDITTIVGQQYTLTFYHEGWAQYAYPSQGALLIGVGGSSSQVLGSFDPTPRTVAFSSSGLTVFNFSASSNVWQQSTATFTAAAASTRIGLYGVGTGTGGSVGTSSVNIDSVSAVVAVPEPGTLAVVGIAGAIGSGIVVARSQRRGRPPFPGAGLLERARCLAEDEVCP